MATITPFVKRMRAQGGTIYTFSSALEDIGLNINERNNVVKMSHYALLNIPTIDAPPQPNIFQENRFNVLGIAGAYQSFLNSGSIKDGRVIVAESFQNYALNLETNLLAQPTYNPALSATISERVFWKWLKETGAIRWQPIDTSAGLYWQEENDTDSSIGYNSIVKAIGQISAGSVRTDTFGTYNETYVLVPTSFGQTPVYFKQVEDDNYKHGLSITCGLTNILGRNPYLNPHPDGLDIQAYYDLPDSSISVGSYTMQYDDSTGAWKNGWWYTPESFNLSDDRDYFIDTDDYKITGIYNIKLQYAEPAIQFNRSKVDCLSIEYDLNKLKTIFADDHLTFDKLAIQDSIDDSYQFNAILIYYSVYNQALDTVLATNLLGILFLDPPSGNTQSYPINQIVLPAITKLQSGPNGFGTSYSFRLNIKSDYMLDDTQAIVTDTTASQQVLADFSQVFDSLGKTLGILNQQTGTINYITEQYLDLSAQQTNLLNQMNSLQQEVNNLGVGIQGTENAITMFASGNDPLIDSSIYMKNGKIGLFNNDPAFPVQIDASLKTKDIYIENAIRDTNGNILLGYGSPQQLGSKTNFRELDIYTGNNTPAIHIDTSNNVFINNIATSSYVTETSLGTSFIWNAGVLDVSLPGGGASVAYVNAQNLIIDASIIDIKATYIPNASLGTGFAWAGSVLTVNVSTAGIDFPTMQAYVDPQFATQAGQIAAKIELSALAPYATTYSVDQAVLPYATNASIGLAGFAKTTALASYLPLAGGTISGNLAVSGNTNLGERHAMAIGNSDIVAGAIQDMDDMSVTITPKGTKLFIMFSAPFHTNITSRGGTITINVANSNVRSCCFRLYQQVMNVSFQHISGFNDMVITPGIPITVKIKWSGDTAIHQGDSYANTERILTVIDLY